MCHLAGSCCCLYAVFTPLILTIISLPPITLLFSISAARCASSGLKCCKRMRYEYVCVCTCVVISELIVSCASSRVFLCYVHMYYEYVCVCAHVWVFSVFMSVSEQILLIHARQHMYVCMGSGKFPHTRSCTLCLHINKPVCKICVHIQFLSRTSRHVDNPTSRHVDKPILKYADNPTSRHVDKPTSRHVDNPASKYTDNQERMDLLTRI